MCAAIYMSWHFTYQLGHCVDFIWFSLQCGVYKNTSWVLGNILGWDMSPSLCFCQFKGECTVEVCFTIIFLQVNGNILQHDIYIVLLSSSSNNNVIHLSHNDELTENVFSESEKSVINKYNVSTKWCQMNLFTVIETH